VRKLLIVLLTGLVILTTAVVRVDNISLDKRVAQIVLLFNNKKRGRDQLRLQQIYQSDLTADVEKGKEQ
jgi:uncharacterized protein YxeA